MNNASARIGVERPPQTTNRFAQEQTAPKRRSHKSKYTKFGRRFENLRSVSQTVNSTSSLFNVSVGFDRQQSARHLRGFFVTIRNRNASSVS